MRLKSAATSAWLALSLALVILSHLQTWVAALVLTVDEDSVVTVILGNGTLVVPPRRGTLSHLQVALSTGHTVSEGKTYAYVPDRDFVGHDAFAYAVEGTGNRLVVDVVVKPVNE